MPCSAQGVTPLPFCECGLEWSRPKPVSALNGMEVDNSFWSQKISFSYFSVKIFLKNLSFILEFSFREAIVTQKENLS